MLDGRLAQWLERCVDIAEVIGSSPLPPTIGLELRVVSPISARYNSQRLGNGGSNFRSNSRGFTIRPRCKKFDLSPDCSPTKDSDRIGGLESVESERGAGDYEKKNNVDLRAVCGDLGITGIVVFSLARRQHKTTSRGFPGRKPLINCIRR